MNTLFYYTGAMVYIILAFIAGTALIILMVEIGKAIYFGTDFLNWYNRMALSMDPTYKMKVSYPRAWCASVGMMWLFNPNTDTHTMKGGHIYRTFYCTFYRTPSQRKADKAYTMEDAVEDQMPYHGE